ncbi:MAG: adenosylmethionine decarboxylase [bacterium]
MNTLGRHLLIEYRGCNGAILDDLPRIEALMLQAAEAAGATIVQSVFHRFSPHGVTGVVVVAESHLSIHTWPEYGYAAVDFFTCGDCRPEAAHEVLEAGMLSRSHAIVKVERGMEPPGPGLRLMEAGGEVGEWHQRAL